MKTLSLIIASLLALTLIVWSSAQSAFQAYLLYLPELPIALFLVVLLLFFREKQLQTPAKKIADFVIKYRYTLPFIAFFMGVAIRFFVFGNIPHIQDSIHYKMVGEWITEGRLSHPPIPSYEFYRYIYFIGSPTTFYSLFLPGYPLFLSFFIAIKMVWIVNPLLLALTIFFTGKLAEKMAGKAVATLTMIFTLCSSFVVFMAGTGMAHNFTAFLTVLAVSLFYHLINSDKIVTKKDYIYPALIGFSVGWLMMTRPQNAIFLSVALTPFALYFGKKQPKKALLYLLLTLIPFAGWMTALLIYNNHFTGSPFTFIQDIYFNYSEPTRFCHRLGMGNGCFKSNWDILPEAGLTFQHALWVTWKRLTSLSMNLLAHPITLIFPAIAFFPLMNSKNKELLLPASLFLTSVAGYFFFYFDANVFGPRYYYETTFFLLILLAAGVINLPKLYPHRVVKLTLIAFFPLLFIFHFSTVVPQLIKTYRQGFWDVNIRLREAVEKKNIHNAVVFVSPQKLIGSGLAVMNMRDIEKNDVIYARHLGVEENSALMTRLPSRKFYLAKWNRWKDTRTKLPTITELKTTIEPDHIAIEIEQKSYPLSCQPDYCNAFPDKAALNRFMPIPPPYHYTFSNNKGWYCRIKQNQCYDFGQYFPTSGEWKIELRALVGPQMGKFTIKIDGKAITEIDMYDTSFRKKSFYFSADIPKGFHLLTLTSHQKDDNFFLLDSMTFDRNSK
ncbi:hypothetical protein KAH37_04150 [bacterium]|nr:hypothetical protein [bacterium]